MLNSQIAIALQEYITSFAETGNRKYSDLFQPFDLANLNIPANEQGVPYFVMYGQNATVQNLNITGISEVMDPTANARCNWWQKALYV